MTGYRLGYVMAPRPFVEPLLMLGMNGHTSVPPFIQRAGIAALTGPQDFVASRWRRIGRGAIAWSPGYARSRA